MQGVSGITGAGLLLHRVVMETAKRVSPGALGTPAEVGAVGIPVCRLSGLRVTAQCTQLTEWFAPGTAPTGVDDWERDGRVSLPDECATWSQQQGGPLTYRTALAESTPRSRDESALSRVSHFRILSPQDGDRYAVPAGVEPRYATISLRAVGPGAERVRWSIEGVPYDAERCALVLGTHVFKAVTSRGDTSESRVAVERQNWRSFLGTH